jgi:hypothetical protein
MIQRLGYLGLPSWPSKSCRQDRGTQAAGMGGGGVRGMQTWLRSAEM